jgi:hypothetical protein
MYILGSKVFYPKIFPYIFQKNLCSKHSPEVIPYIFFIQFAALNSEINSFWSVTHKIVYGPQLRIGPSNILCVTSRSVNCHMALIAINCLINMWWTNIKLYIDRAQVHILKYWPINIRKYWATSQTKTNRENKNVKYNAQSWHNAPPQPKLT